jgi:hypothetical protein
VLVLSDDPALRRDAATLLAAMLLDLAVVATIKARVRARGCGGMLRSDGAERTRAKCKTCMRRRACAAPGRHTTCLTCSSSPWTATPSPAVCLCDASVCCACFAHAKHIRRQAIPRAALSSPACSSPAPRCWGWCALPHQLARATHALTAALQGAQYGALFCAWAACTSASRVVMGRHYVGDVLAGVLLGGAELAAVRALTPQVCAA